MGPPISRVGDIALGHGSFGPTPAIAGSGDVFACGPAVHRQGDAILLHPSPSPSPPHGRSAASGSTTVFTNSKPTVRIGDSVDCGGSLAMGCNTVLVGG